MTGRRESRVLAGEPRGGEGVGDEGEWEHVGCGGTMPSHQRKGGQQRDDEVVPEQCADPAVHEQAATLSEERRGEIGGGGGGLYHLCGFSGDMI